MEWQWRRELAKGLCVRVEQSLMGWVKTRQAVAQVRAPVCILEMLIEVLLCAGHRSRAGNMAVGDTDPYPCRRRACIPKGRLRPPPRQDRYS